MLMVKYYFPKKTQGNASPDSCWQREMIRRLPFGHRPPNLFSGSMAVSFRRAIFTYKTGYWLTISSWVLMDQGNSYIATLVFRVPRQSRLHNGKFWRLPSEFVCFSVQHRNFKIGLKKNESLFLNGVRMPGAFKPWPFSCPQNVGGHLEPCWTVLRISNPKGQPQGKQSKRSQCKKCRWLVPFRLIVTDVSYKMMYP